MWVSEQPPSLGFPLKQYNMVTARGSVVVFMHTGVSHYVSRKASGFSSFQRPEVLPLRPPPLPPAVEILCHPRVQSHSTSYNKKLSNGFESLGFWDLFWEVKCPAFNKQKGFDETFLGFVFSRIRWKAIG